jgi:tetratricopeptide (TPR) repeat protein
MTLTAAPERGTSGSPATARARSRRLLFVAAAGGLVAAFVSAVFVVRRPDDASTAEATKTAASPAISPAATSPTIAQLEARTNADPTDLGARQQLSRLYLVEAIRSGDPAYYELTRRSLDIAEHLNPGDHATTVTEGVLALSLHDFTRAHDLGQTARRQDAADPDPVAILIDSSVELGRYDEAETHIGELLDLRPGSAALSRLSYLRELRGDLGGARLAMLQAEQAAAGSPADLATIATFVGDQMLAERDIAKAAEAYDEARRSTPGLVTTEIGRARLAAASGDVAAGIATLSAVVDRTPTPAAATLLGELQEAASRETDAKASFELARAGYRLLIAAGSTVDLESALFEADHGNPTEAVRLGRAAYAERHTVFAADALAWALTRDGHAADALPYVAEALRLGTRSPILHAHAAFTYAAAGDDTRASRELRIAFASSGWLVPTVRPAVATLADRLHVRVPTDWRP